MKPMKKSLSQARSLFSRNTSKMVLGAGLSLLTVDTSQALTNLLVFDTNVAPGVGLTATSTTDIGPGWSIILRSATANVMGAVTGGIGANGVITPYDSGSIHQALQTGINLANGYWDGYGIQSSFAAADAGGGTGIGAIDNSQYGWTSWNPTNVPGQPALMGFDFNTANTGIGQHALVGDANEILIKFTWLGDANLDGIIDATDVQQINFGLLNQPQASWLNGDFDYSGYIDTGDIQLFNAGLIEYTGYGGPLFAGNDGKSPGGSVVPEPASLGLLMVGALGLLGRRRKSENVSA